MKLFSLTKLIPSFNSIQPGNPFFAFCFCYLEEILRKLKGVEKEGKINDKKSKIKSETKNKLELSCKLKDRSTIDVKYCRVLRGSSRV